MHMIYTMKRTAAERGPFITIQVLSFTKPLVDQAFL